MIEDYVFPNNLKEAVRYLSGRQKSMVIAAGTTVYELRERGFLRDVRRLVDITRLCLDYVKEGEGNIKIGGVTPIARLAESSLLRKARLGALVDAAEAILPIQVRNVGTLGGQLCSGIPLFDLPTALLPLDCIAEIQGRKGRRSVGISKFFQGYFQTSVAPGEILVQVKIKKPSANSGTAFVKLGRTANDFAIVNSAAYLRFDDGQVCREARVSIGAIEDKPKILRSSDLLVGTPVNHRVLETIIEEVKKEVSPLDVIHASASYQRFVAGIVVGECIRKAMKRAIQK